MATGLDQALAARVVVRVRGRAGAIVGAGFLAGPDLVATCAHVVAEALAADPYGPAPSACVRLELPLFLTPGADGPPSVDAEVIRWRPIAADGTGDVAVLRMRGPLPPGCRMPPVRRVDRLWGHGFRVLGFPDGLADGVWTTGRLRGEQGTRWFQLQAAAGEHPIVGGYSGSPVWDEESGAVVGMTVAADSSGATTTAYLVPIDQVLGVDPELLPCPYRGLEPFGEEHAAFFFGRDAAVAELAAAVSERPLVAITGPSGAGKSSLVRAGLLPRMRASGARVVELRPQPGGAALDTVLAALPPGAPTPDVGARIADAQARPAAVLELASALAEPTTVLVADQFEESVATDPRTAQELLALVGELVTALPRRSDGRWPVRAVLTLRTATIDEVLSPEIAGLLGAGTVLVPPMARGQLREAIVAPAERAPGLTFETGLVERILDDAAAEPGGLPLVESVLAELWERRSGGMLTLEAYEGAGGVAGVVATHAEQVAAQFTGTPAEQRLRRFLTSLAGQDRDGRFVRRSQHLADLPPDLAPLVDPLVAGRLVVVEDAPGSGGRVHVAHQALIDHWPRLHSWLTEDGAFLTWRDQLDQQRDRWDAAARDEGALLRGSGLATAQEWLERRADDVPAPAREYVERSRARQRREVRRWRVVTAVLAVLVLVSCGFAGATVISRNQVGEQLRLANAELLGQAALARAGDPGTASALALAGWQADPANAAVRTALARLAMGTHSVSAVFADLTVNPIGDYGASEDGMVLATRDVDDRVVVLFGLPTGNVDRWDVPGSAGSASRVSPDGRWLAVADSAGNVDVWDVTARTGPVRLSGLGVAPADAVTLEFGPRSDRLSWLTPPGPQAREVVVWDLARGATVQHAIGPVTDPAVSAVVLTGDPTALLEITAGPDSRMTVRSLTDGSVRFSHLPQTLIAGGPLVITCAPDEPGVALVREDTGADLRRIRLLGDRCDGVLLQSRRSLDGLHLVEPRATGAERDVDVFRITSLVDGSTYDLASPPNPRGTPGDVRDVGFMTVVPAPDGGRSVLVPRGRSALLLHAPRDAGRLSYPPDNTYLTDDGRYAVALDEDHVTVLDPVTGLPGAELRPSTLPDAGSSQTSVSDRVSMLTATADHWVYREFEIPSLAPLVRAQLPAPTGVPPAGSASVGASDERVSGMTGGVLSTWERSTGAPTGEPIVLADAPDTMNVERTAFSLRPGPQPQLAVVVGNGEIELWNPVTGTVDAVLEAPASRSSITAEYDRTGSRLVALGIDMSIEVWDVDRRVPVSDAFPIGSVPPLFTGIDADGYLVLAQAAGSPDTFQLTFWDIGTGRQSGSVRISTANDAPGSLAEDGRSLVIDGKDGAMPFAYPVTSDGWVEQLCRFTDRPFTAEERSLIPAGVDVESPCR